MQDTSLRNLVKCVTPSKNINIIKQAKSQANASNATSVQLESHQELEGLKAVQKLGKVATSDCPASTTKPVKNKESERDTDTVHHGKLEFVISKNRAIRQATYKKTYPDTSSSSSKEEMISRQTIRKWKTREDKLSGTIKYQ